ncbi:hypothetical protein GW17_00056016, partial [Ensete ventricosum]
LEVWKVSKNTAAREATVREACGSKKGLYGDGSGAKSSRGKEHVPTSRANPTTEKTPYPWSMKDLR